MGIFFKYKRRNFIIKKKNNKEGWQGVLQEIQSGISKWLAIILVKNILYPKFVMISCRPPRPKLWNHCQANFETMISLEIVIWLVNLNLHPPCCSWLLPPSICPLTYSWPFLWKEVYIPTCSWFLVPLELSIPSFAYQKINQMMLLTWYEFFSIGF